MYKIEITAETLAELAGKAMSLAVKLNTATESGPVVKGATHVVTYEVAPEVAEVAPVDPTPAPKSTPAAEEPASSGQTEASAPPTEEKSSASAELNFDTDIAPLVLQVVKDKGKPVAQEILSQFGVEKASMLDASRWPELVVALKDAL